MYCTNCGKNIGYSERFCTNCGSAINVSCNNLNNSDIKKEDKPNVFLIILCILCPIAGFVMFLCMKDSSPKSAKSYGISALISFIISSILAVLCFVFAFLAFMSASNFINEDDWGTHFFEEYNDYNTGDDISYFKYDIDNYVKLASGNFYKDLYLDKTMTEKCYNADDLMNSDYYDGSILVRMVNGEEEMIVWITNYDYYVEAVNYKDLSLNDIRIGERVDYSCGIGNLNNSL